MHFYTLAFLFAATAFAAPHAAPRGWPETSTTPSTSPTTSSSGNQCSQNQQESCCNAPNGSAVAGLQCTLGLLGGTCSGSVQCCNVDGNGKLINTSLCVPIQL